MPDTWPEPYATVARMRRERRTERAIAQHLSITPDTLTARTRRWNRDNPDNPLPPPDIERKREEREMILDLIRQGEHPDRVAQITGFPYARVRSAYDRARTKGLVVPLRRPLSDAHDAWIRQRHGGGAPPSGTLADVLRRLRPEHYEKLLRHQKTADEALAETVAALLTEVLDGR